MKIAAACKKDALCDFANDDVLFIFFDIDNGRIRAVNDMPFMSGSMAECADFLVKNEVDLLLAPSISDEAKQILDDAGVHLIDNLQGNPRILVEAYLTGSLFDNEKYFIK